MGNIGSIEKVMVFGILVIIVTILGIAFYSATKVDNDLTSNQMDAGGQDPVVLLDGPGSVEPPMDDGNGSSSQRPVVRDVRPRSVIDGTLEGDTGEGGGRDYMALNSTLPQTMMQQGDRPRGERNREENMNQNRSDTRKPASRSSASQNSTGTQKNSQREYTVKKGDSFMSIARVILGDEHKFKLLMEANPDVDPMSLQIGQKLKIPNAAGNIGAEGGTFNPAQRKTSKPSKANGQGETYVVKSGDTLASISLTIYGTSKHWKKIYEANRAVISNPDVLSVGDILTLPSKN